MHRAARHPATEKNRMSSDAKPQPVPAVRSVTAGRGLDWITEGWALFLRAPGPWIALVLLVFVISMICTVVPVLGNLLSPFVSAVLSAGALLAARKLQTGGTLQVADLFAIFYHPALKSVLIVAGIYVGLILVAVMVFAAITFGAGGMAMLAGALNGDASATAGGLLGIAFGGLVFLALMAPITTMYWFAIPAVLFQGAEPWSAMKQSLSACLANMMSLLVYGVLVLIAFSVAMIPFMLGLLVVVPVLFASWLISYQDIYGVEAAPTA
jgi:uncharacterized membrane protein